jgi:hypothetical protein
MKRVTKLPLSKREGRMIIYRLKRKEEQTIRHPHKAIFLGKYIPCVSDRFK